MASATPELAEQLEAEDRRDAAARPACEYCDGAGYVRGEFTGQRGSTSLERQPPPIREVLRCPVCSAPDAATRLERAGLPPASRAQTLDSFELRDGKEAARDAVSDWCQRLSGGEPCSLLLAGENGRGKTHLAAAAVNALVGRGQAVRFVVAADLLQELRAAIGSDDSTVEQLLARFASVPVLVLDDLARVQVTPWVEETIATLIDRRQRAQLPTLITLDVSHAQIADLFGSRLSAAHVRGGCRGWPGHAGSAGRSTSRCGSPDPEPRHRGSRGGRQMDGLALLGEARGAGLTVSTDGEKLMIQGPGRLEAIAQRLLTNKPDVMTALVAEIEATITEAREMQAAWRGASIELAERCGWPRVPFGPGRAVVAGPNRLRQFVRAAPVPDLQLVVEALRDRVASIEAPNRDRREAAN